MGDARKLGERNWRIGARNRDSWQKLLKESLAQKGSRCANDDDDDDDVWICRSHHVLSRLTA